MVRDVHPVVRDLEQVDRADLIERADELLLDVPGQVAAVEEIERAQAEPEDDAPGVVRRVDRLVGGRLGAERVGGASGFRIVAPLAARTRPRSRPGAGGGCPAARRVRFPSLAGGRRWPRGSAAPGTVGEAGAVAIGGLGVGQPPVPEPVDPDSLGQPSDAAEVVRVPVRRDQVVEVVELGLVRSTASIRFGSRSSLPGQPESIRIDSRSGVTTSVAAPPRTSMK